MTKKLLTRSYSQLILLPTFEERFEYLRLDGTVGEETFGFDRYLNQYFYKTKEWQDVRNFVIVRDNGFDLGVNGLVIPGSIYIHHINPIAIEDIVNHEDWILNPDFLICASFNTHQAIHYGSLDMATKYEPTERRPFDTCPWKLHKVS